MSEAEPSRLERLLAKLDLRALGADRFVSEPGAGRSRLFGGLVAAQSLVAAGRSVDAAAPHSLHAYFLRAGRSDAPIRFEVERTRDGRRFAARRVVALQDERAIFQMAASFTSVESGVAHQDPAPATPPPDGLDDWEDVRARLAEHARPRREFEAFDVRVLEPERDAPGARSAPTRAAWLRAARRPARRSAAAHGSARLRERPHAAARRGPPARRAVGRASAGEPRPRALVPPRARAHRLDPVRLSQSRGERRTRPRVRRHVRSGPARGDGGAGGADRELALGYAVRGRARRDAAAPIEFETAAEDERWRSERRPWRSASPRFAACSARSRPAPAPPSTTRAGPATRCGSSPMRSTRSASRWTT